MRMKIALTPVESSQIAAIGHDAATNTLAVQFKNKKGLGNVYHYDNVPADVYQQFTAAESKGRFFGANIKDVGFVYHKIEPEAEQKPDEEGATA